MAQHVRHLKMNANPRVKRVLEAAHDEAAKLGADYMGVEHLTLALAAESEGMFADAIQSLGVSRDALRDEILRRLESVGVVPAVPSQAKPFILPGHEPKKRKPEQPAEPLPVENQSAESPGESK